MGRLTAVAVAVVTIAAAAVAVDPPDPLVDARGSARRDPRRCPFRTRGPDEARAHPRQREGRTLYLYMKDRGTKSACSRRCSQVWPPATVSGAPTAGPGVTAAKLTTTRGADNRRQLVYYGHPLYTLTADVRPGQINGEGFLGTWYVISAAGKRIGKLSHSSSEY